MVLYVSATNVIGNIKHQCKRKRHLSLKNWGAGAVHQVYKKIFFMPQENNDD